MNVEIGTEAKQFPEKEYINGILLAMYAPHQLPALILKALSEGLNCNKTGDRHVGRSSIHTHAPKSPASLQSSSRPDQRDAIAKRVEIRHYRAKFVPG
jgi:hypothetical protein